MNNQKTPTILLLSPNEHFHSFGFTARDFYHDLDHKEAKRWYFFDKFKMILHHNKVWRNVVDTHTFHVKLLRILEETRW